LENPANRIFLGDVFFILDLITRYTLSICFGL